MGFVGGGGNIAIVSALPLSSLLTIINIFVAYVYSTFKILLVPETSVSEC